MSFEKNLAAIAKATEELVDHIKKDGETLAETFSRIATQVAERPVTNNASANDNAFDSLYGFKEGDEVIYVGPATPGGVTGVVKRHGIARSREGMLPVVRDDQLGNDFFPARDTMRVESFKRYTPKTEFVPWYKRMPSPSDSKKSWNLDIVEAAIDNELTIEFEYLKPSDNIWLSDERTTRKVKPVKLLGNDNFLAREIPSTLLGSGSYNFRESGHPKTFKIERMSSYAKVID